MTDTVIGRLAALKTMPMPELKAQWRELFDTEPPPLQPPLPGEPARLPHPGAGLWRAEARDGRAGWRRWASSSTAATSPCAASAPTTGRSPARGWSASSRASSTRVTVLTDGFEWQGRPYQSLSAIARAITGTRWNGLVFFGLQEPGSAA